MTSCMNLTEIDKQLLNTCCNRTKTLHDYFSIASSSGTSTANLKKNYEIYYNDYCSSPNNNNTQLEGNRKQQRNEPPTFASTTTTTTTTTTIAAAGTGIHSYKCPLNTVTYKPYSSMTVYLNKTSTWCRPLQYQVREYILYNLSQSSLIIKPSEYMQTLFTSITNNNINNNNNNDDMTDIEYMTDILNTSLTNAENGVMAGLVDSRFNCTKLPVCEVCYYYDYR